MHVFINIGNWYLAKNYCSKFCVIFPGVLDLIIIATKDSTIGEKIKALTWKVQSEGVRSSTLLCNYTCTCGYLWYAW